MFDFDSEVGDRVIAEVSIPKGLFVLMQRYLDISGGACDAFVSAAIASLLVAWVDDAAIAQELQSLIDKGGAA